MFVARPQLYPLGEIHHAKPGNVGDAETVAGHVLGVAERSVQGSEEPLRSPAPAFHQAFHGGDAFAAGNGTVGKHRIAVAKRIGHRHQAIELHMALRRGDKRTRLGIRAHQRRIRLQRLEIDADGQRFVDDGAIVQHQRRHQTARIDGAVLRLEVLAGR